MKKTINRVFGLMLAVALPMAGLTIAANTTSTTAPASLQLDVAAATPATAVPIISGNTTATPKSTARPIYDRTSSTPYPSMIYDPINNTYSSPLIGDSYSTVQRYSVVGSWWSSYADIMANTNTSVISVDDWDSSTIYVGPWSRTEIASDYLITLR